MEKTVLTSSGSEKEGEKQVTLTPAVLNTSTFLDTVAPNLSMYLCSRPIPLQTFLGEKEQPGQEHPAIRCCSGSSHSPKYTPADDSLCDQYPGV